MFILDITLCLIMREEILKALEFQFFMSGMSCRAFRLSFWIRDKKL